MRKVVPFNTWVRLLSTLSLPIRLTIVLLCLLVCLVIYALVYPVIHQGTILTIPMILGAWMFKRRGVLILLAITVGLLIIYHIHRLGTIYWPVPFALSFLSGIIIVLFVGFMVTALRDFVDTVDVARQQAQQAREQLALAYEQQRQLNHLKTQFILNVNHELRTPLTAIISSLELCQLILEKQGSLERTLHGPYLQAATEESEKLRTLIEEVLDTKIISDQSIQLIYEEVPVSEVVHDSINSLEVTARDSHPIQLDVPAGLTVWADANGLHKILFQLLSNASKYSPAGTPITIRAAIETTIDQKGDSLQYVCISVQDKGAGIPSDELPFIFDRFARLKRDIGGTTPGNGLGLYISRTLVEAMNGDLWVESTGVPGEGSRFCFTLPCPPLQRSLSRLKETNLSN